MPFYKFKNKKTGRTFEKLLTFEEHDRYLENKNLVQIQRERFDTLVPRITFYFSISLSTNITKFSVDMSDF